MRSPFFVPVRLGPRLEPPRRFKDFPRILFHLNPTILSSPGGWPRGITGYGMFDGFPVREFTSLSVRIQCQSMPDTGQEFRAGGPACWKGRKIESGDWIRRRLGPRITA